MSSANTESRFEKTRVPLFNSVFVICHGSEEESRDFLSRELMYDPEGSTLPTGVEGQSIQLMNEENGSRAFILRLPEGDVCPNALAHELYHVTRGILKYHEVDDEETGAYLMGWLLEFLS